LRRQMAKARFYATANRWHLLGSALALALALASPFVLLYRPDLGPLLGAIAGTWIFASRLLFEPVKKGCQTKGAAAQELFDCDVLGLPWNDSLARQPSDEEIRKASNAFRTAKRTEKHKRWYPAQADQPWPQSVITCQRSNAVWARRQHRAYGIFLEVVAAAWFTFGVVLALVHGSSLADYMTTIALPSLPALLDAIEVSKKHRDASLRRQDLEDQTNVLFDQPAPSPGDMREVQDQLFVLRRDAPPVAGWFYGLISKAYEEDMRYAAAERAGETRR
jgi:hypothetical protein